MGRPEEDRDNKRINNLLLSLSIYALVSIFLLFVVWIWLS